MGMVISKSSLLLLRCAFSKELIYRRHLQQSNKKTNNNNITPHPQPRHPCPLLESPFISRTMSDDNANSCQNGYDGYGGCYSAWDSWARWVVLGIIIVGALFLFFLFS